MMIEETPFGIGTVWEHWFRFLEDDECGMLEEIRKHLIQKYRLVETLRLGSLYFLVDARV
jgi:hypothetical protein